jgi:hypothetical protein
MNEIIKNWTNANNSIQIDWKFKSNRYFKSIKNKLLSYYKYLYINLSKIKANQMYSECMFQVLNKCKSTYSQKESVRYKGSWVMKKTSNIYQIRNCESNVAIGKV